MAEERFLRFLSYFGGPKVELSHADRDWEVSFPAPIGNTFSAHPRSIARFYQTALKFCQDINTTGQDENHLQSMLMIQANWPLITEQLHHVGGECPVFCVPEVKFPNRTMVDCVGTDQAGLAYVVEIGTKRKNGQLERGILTVQHYFPELFVVGLRAYHQVTKTKSKLFMSWFER